MGQHRNNGRDPVQWQHDEDEEGNRHGRRDRRSMGGKGSGDAHARPGLGAVTRPPATSNGFRPSANGHTGEGNQGRQEDPYRIPVCLARVRMSIETCGSIRYNGLLPMHGMTLELMRTLVVPHWPRVMEIGTGRAWQTIDVAARFSQFLTEERLEGLVRGYEWRHKLWNKRETEDAGLALGAIAYGVHASWLRSAGRALLCGLAMATGLTEEQAFRIDTSAHLLSCFLDYRTLSAINDSGLFNCDDPRVRAGWEFLRLSARGLPLNMLKELLDPITEEQVQEVTGVKQAEYLSGMNTCEEKTGAWAAVRLMTYFFEANSAGYFFNAVLMQSLKAYDESQVARNRIVYTTTGDGQAAAGGEEEAPFDPFSEGGGASAGEGGAGTGTQAGGKQAACRIRSHSPGRGG